MSPLRLAHLATGGELQHIRFNSEVAGPQGCGDERQNRLEASRQDGSLGKIETASMMLKILTPKSKENYYPK
jgi:hypothetical protein